MAAAVALGNEVRLQVNEQTQVWRDGQQASLQDLQEGSQVRATYQQQEGQQVVTRIDVTESGQGAAPTREQDSGATGESDSDAGWLQE